MEELKKGLATLFQHNNNNNNNSNQKIKTHNNLNDSKEPDDNDTDYLHVLSCGCIPALNDIYIDDDNSENAYGHNVEGEREPLHFQDEEILDRMLSWLSRLSKRSEDDEDDNDDEEDDDDEYIQRYLTENANDPSMMRDDRNNTRDDEPSICSDARSQLSKASKVSFAYPPVTAVRSRPKTSSFENSYLYFSDEYEDNNSDIDADVDVNVSNNINDYDTVNNPDKCEI